MEIEIKKKNAKCFGDLPTGQLFRISWEEGCEDTIALKIAECYCEDDPVNCVDCADGDLFHLPGGMLVEPLYSAKLVIE